MPESIAIAVFLFIAALLAYAATRPDHFRVERTTRIAAPPARVFALVDDLRQWSSWSPWEGLDPALKRTYGGAERGCGAAYAWDGNRKVGAGRMEIVESLPASKIAIRLDILRPFEAHNTAEFIFSGSGGGTTVTWAMHGPSPYLSKLMGLFVSMDRMIGRQFELGLSRLKSLAEQ